MASKKQTTSQTEQILAQKPESWIYKDPYTSFRAMEWSCSNDSRKSLSNKELILHIMRIVNDRERAELIILELMEEHSFSFADFKQLLKGMPVDH